MNLAKQFGRSALALAVISLSGCQLLQFGAPTQTTSSVMKDDHAKVLLRSIIRWISI